MFRKLAYAVAFVLTASPVWADQDSGKYGLTLNLGGFALRAEDARVPGDVLFENRNYLAFDIKEFNAATFGGEWLVGVGDFIEIGAGAEYFGRSVPSVYADLVNQDGSEIAQDLKLRIVSIPVTARFGAFGNGRRLEPYGGGGIVLLAWRYSETGQFVDYTDLSVFRNKYVASGTTVSPIVLGGLRLFVTPRFGVGGEIRYQKGEGKLSSDFYGDRIDLGGMTYLFTFKVRF